HQTAVLFLLENSGRSTSHAEFVKKYNRARDQLNEGETDVAIATLEQAFKTRINLYEAAMGSYALALAYAQKKDWPRALFHIRHAVISDQKYLIDEMRVPALAAQVELESRNGNFTEALCAFDKLHPIDPDSARGASPAAKAAAQLEAALADKAPLVINAELAVHPLIDAPAVWRHRLLRSKFSFSEVKGEVKSFALSCIGNTLTAAVNTVMQWTVPEKAGACILRVDGEPGATFKLVEK
ncbi:MAG: tetratricopeptide repeat protein, partial [Burkholderiales bacterium]